MRDTHCEPLQKGGSGLVSVSIRKRGERVPAIAGCCGRDRSRNMACLSSPCWLYASIAREAYHFNSADSIRRDTASCSGGPASYPILRHQEIGYSSQARHSSKAVLIPNVPKPGDRERKRLFENDPKSLENKRILQLSDVNQSSGEGGIRTLGTVARTPVFETGPIDHSGTSPMA